MREREGSLSELGEQSFPLSLDVVRARIFYLASDIEPVSAPAAMLLRAVADAIEDTDRAEAIAVTVHSNGAAENLLSQVTEMRALGSRPRDVAPVVERRLGVVGSQSLFKR